MVPITRSHHYVTKFFSAGSKGLSNNPLNSRLAWVTGASGGIGSEICDQLKEQGWDVRCLNRTEIDLSQTKSIHSWLEKNKSDAPDLIVCNAGGNIPKELANSNANDFRNWLENNFLGHVALVQGVISDMAARKTGKIIFISSAYALKSKQGRSQYSVSKAAQDAYMRSLALEFAQHGIIVNSISPGFIDTPLTNKNNSQDQIKKLIKKIPMDRLGTTVEVARLVTFLASDSNSYITGQNINIDGGFSLQ